MHLTKYCLLLLLLFPLLAAAQSSEKYLRRNQYDYGQLYFIAPITFKAVQGKGALIADFTYAQLTNPGPGADTVVVLASLITPFLVQEIGNLTLLIGANRIATVPAERMYLEQVKGKWENRIRAKISTAALLQLLEKPDSAGLLIEINEQERRHHASSRWRKAAASIYPILSFEWK